MNARQVVLVVALVATLAASWWIAQREDEEVDSAAVVQPAERAVPASGARSARSAAGGDANAASRLERLSVTRSPWPDLPDVARIVSFAPPRPVRSAAAPVPVAPPLPFRLVGAIDDERGKAVFLLDGNQVRMVRAGEQVAGNYRLDRITPAGVEFTYLPLKTKQTLTLRTP